MLGDWKRACTSRTLVDSAPAGSQALALFFSAPISFPESGNAITSTTSQKPTTIHLVQLPAGISVSLLATLFIGSPGSAGRYVVPLTQPRAQHVMQEAGKPHRGTIQLATATAAWPPTRRQRDPANVQIGPSDYLLFVMSVQR